MSEPTIIVGLDVAKIKIDGFIDRDRTRFCLDNSAEGAKKLIEKLEKFSRGSVRILMEATGGYERLFHETLTQAGFIVSIVNAKRVRDFAKALGRLAKTDRIDAETIAIFGAHCAARPTELLDSQRIEVRDHLQYRNQIIDDIKARRGQLRTARSEAVRAEMSADIEILKEKLKTLTKRVGVLVANCSPEIKKVAELVATFKGAGPIVVATLIAYVPELGRLSDKQIAALTGLAPFARDSGKHRGKRVTDGGRSHVRSVLYTAAMAAIQHNPAVRTFYQRLVSRGKPRLVALVASMRKIIVIINAMVQKGKEWEPQTKTA